MWHWKPGLHESCDGELESATCPFPSLFLGQLGKIIALQFIKECVSHSIHTVVRTK